MFCGFIWTDDPNKIMELINDTVFKYGHITLRDLFDICTTYADNYSWSADINDVVRGATDARHVEILKMTEAPNALCANKYAVLIRDHYDEVFERIKKENKVMCNKLEIESNRACDKKVRFDEIEKGQIFMDSWGGRICIKCDNGLAVRLETGSLLRFSDNSKACLIKARLIIED